MLPRRALGVAFVAASALGLATLATTAAAAPPDVTITSPAAGNPSYELGSTVLADYECTETGALTPPTCVGTIPDGSAIDTSSLGAKPFSVTGTSTVAPFESNTVNHPYTVVDTVPPTSPSLIAPGSGSATNDSTPKFTWNPGTDPGGSGMQSHTIVINGVGTVLPGTAGEHTPGGLTDGVYTWKVIATDVAGNTSESPEQTVTVDTQKPNAPTLTSPIGGAFVNSQTPTLNWTAATDAGSDVASQSVVIDGGPAIGVGAAATSFTPSSNLNEGLHTWKVTAVDNADNTIESAEGTFSVDVTDPTAPVLQSPQQGSTTNDPTPEFQWQAATDLGGSGVDSQSIVIDGVSTAIPANATTFQQPSNLPLSEGVHTWKVTAVDNAGNTSESVLQGSFTVDTTAPDAPTLTLPPNPTTSTSITIGFAGLPGAEFNWQVVDTANPGTPIESGSTTATSVTLPVLAEGVYSVSVTQTDPGKNTGGDDTQTLTIDQTAPGAPTIAQRPSAISAHDAALIFGITGDAHPNFGLGTYGWQVRNSGGQVVKSGSVAAGAGTTQVNLGSLPANNAYSFTVQQVDQAGNAGPFSAGALFSILPPPDSPPPSGGPTPAIVPPAATGGSPPPTDAGPTTNEPVKPATSNAKRLKPRAAQKLSSRRPLLRWPRIRSATTFNVQIFRVEGNRFVKVYSGFPRSNRLRVPTRALKFGERYVWRVWPFRGRKAAKNPIGSSFFDIRSKDQIYALRVLGPKRVLEVGKNAQVRWRPRTGTKQYRLRLMRDGKREFQMITRRKRASIPGQRLSEAGTYTLLVHLGVGRPKARKFGATWIRVPLQVATAAQLADYRASRDAAAP